tara:strand:+ start:160 stop:396 length:237 start_codon:yes stop_codon:yes gene_type:complete
MNNKIKFQIVPVGRTEKNTAIHIWFLLSGNENIINVEESTENNNQMFIEIEFHINKFEDVARIINSLLELNLIRTEED